MRKKEIYNHRDVFLPRRRQSKNRFFWWAGGFLIAGGLLIGGLYLIFYSPFFKVKNIEVPDLQLLTRDSLLSSFSAQMVGQNRFLSILGPDNILFWFFGKRPENIPALPALAALSVQVNLFKQQVVLTPQERTLAGILCSSDGSACYGFDNEGVVFVRAPQSQGSLILRINDENQRALNLGDKILPDDGWIKNIFDTIEILTANGLHISSVTLGSFDLEEWRANLSAGPVFYFGLNFTIQNFDGILKNLLKRLDLSKLQYLDFRVQNRIYYK